MLKIENLSTSYKTIDGDVHVLKDINFEIKDNEIFGIAGESGCGKTTLLNTLYDIVDYPLVIDQGRVVLEGEKDGKKYSFESGKIRDTWWNNIAYVPQAAQSVLNPIVRLKTQFLDSIPKDQKKKEKPEETEKPEEPEPSKKNTGSAGTIIFVIVALLAVGGAGYYVKIVRPKQLAEDDEDFEDGGYGEGFDPDEAFGETEYLSEDDFDDRMDDNEPEDGE